MIQLIKEDFGELRYELFNGQPLLHTTVSDWSPEVYREMKKYLLDIRQYFKEQGYKTMYVSGRVLDKKVQKFWKMFGFTEIVREDGVTIYKQELV